jgi:general secretion pathway protein A
MNTAVAGHLQQLGLTRPPFPPTPDAACYFHTPSLARELAEAAHCLLDRKGFILLTGEVGMGKSTFVRRLLDLLEHEKVAISLVLNTFLQGEALLAAVLRDFGVEPAGDTATDVDRLNAFLIDRWHEGVTCVLVIDDAQNLGLESLELLRLLSNLETGQEKLLQVVLAGQPELRELLARPGIRQLTTRIVKHIALQPMDAAQARRYVDFRLAMAGAAGRITLEPAAHRALYRDSRGNPRRMHLIMDRCLYGVLVHGDGGIDASLLRTAAAEAGVLPQRARTLSRSRRWALGAAALAMASGIVYAGIALHTPTRTHLAANPAPARPVPAAVTKTHDDATAWQRCLDRLSDPSIPGNAAPLHLVPVPESWTGALRQRGDLCLGRPHARWTVACRPSLRVEQFVAGEHTPDVLVLQTGLAARGIYQGPLDSLFGPRTREALARFQVEHQLAGSGTPDDLTLLQLALAPTPAPATNEKR